ncbi:MAG: response regulator transcription factor, partial [Luteimonas sp.]|nr:response regulator transcription factor [Luteimonas sp.]
KPFEPAELLARVRAIAAHVAAASSTPLLTVGEWQLDLERNLLLHGAQHLVLTALAVRLIELLMHALIAGMRGEWREAFQLQRLARG